MMEEHLNQDNAMKKFLAGVTFDNIILNSTIPKNTVVSIKYKQLVSILYT